MKTVLIIEDDEQISNLERDYLQSAGYEVIVERDGLCGAKTACEASVDIAIVDLMLPSLDGFEVCRQIRAKKELPLIVVSAKSDDIDKVRALGIGVDDYVVKPFSPSELVARVTAHLKRYDRLINMSDGQAPQKFISAGLLNIDEQTHTVTLAEVNITLTSKEFDLLTFLVKNKGQVFSKDILFDRIWGMDAIGDTATVTVHINRIREKIETNTAKPKYIETIWGVGYKFIG